MLIRILLGVLLAVAAPSAASLAQVMAGPNGGQMIDAGAFHVELVVKGGDLRVHVFDHVDAPVAVAKATAVATVMVGEAQEKVTLKPTGGNTLSGNVEMKRSGPAKVLVLLRVPDQAMAMARFDLP
jgi:nitrogen fixation protein FixH